MRSSMGLVVGLILGLIIGGLGGYYLARKNVAPTNVNVTPQATTSNQATPAPTVPNFNGVTLGDVPSKAADMISSDWKIFLNAQNNSGQAGVVTFKDEGNGKTRVIIALVGAPGSSAAGPEPAHIHLGKCPEPGAVKYPLTDVVNGVSDTMVGATVAQLKAMLPLAVNVHKSAAEIKTYVACGDLK